MFEQEGDLQIPRGRLPRDLGLEKEVRVRRLGSSCFRASSFGVFHHFRLAMTITSLCH